MRVHHPALVFKLDHERVGFTRSGLSETELKAESMAEQPSAGWVERDVALRTRDCCAFWLIAQSARLRLGCGDGDPRDTYSCPVVFRQRHDSLDGFKLCRFTKQNARNPCCAEDMCPARAFCRLERTERVEIDRRLFRLDFRDESSIVFGA